MHKGEIIAVSPKGKGKQPDYITILIKSDLFNPYKDNQKWVIVDNSIRHNQIKRGSCEFEINKASVITNIKFSEKKEFNKNSKESVKAFSKLDIFQLAEKLNELGGRCKATQVFPLQATGKPLYDALAYLKT